MILDVCIRCARAGDDCSTQPLRQTRDASSPLSAGASGSRAAAIAGAECAMGSVVAWSEGCFGQLSRNVSSLGCRMSRSCRVTLLINDVCAGLERDCPRECELFETS